jgi:hypothetical protein
VSSATLDRLARVAGARLDSPGRLVLRGVRRAGEHLFMHHTAAA